MIRTRPVTHQDGSQRNESGFYAYTPEQSKRFRELRDGGDRWERKMKNTMTRCAWDNGNSTGSVGTGLGLDASSLTNGEKLGVVVPLTPGSTRPRHLPYTHDSQLQQPQLARSICCPFEWSYRGVSDHQVGISVWTVRMLSRPWLPYPHNRRHLSVEGLD